MINENQKITDFIQVFNGALSNSLCDHIINVSENYPWQKHTWYGYEKKSMSHISAEGDEKEFYTFGLDKITQLQVYPILDECVKKYRKICNVSMTVNFKSAVKINKYVPGSRMKTHVDHIQSLFDGEKKGIPVLSIVGLCNDDFTGGEFIFWKDYNINLKKGDVVVFPSLFMYEHKVKEVISGNRYSIVSWYW